MTDQENGKKGLSRRDFIKSVALATGAGVLASCKPKGAPPESEAIPEVTADICSSRPFGYMCSSDWLGEPPVINDADITNTVTVDVVICGGGHAGTQAALGAAQSGASVAVIERQPEATYSFKGDDICSYNSQFMIDKGFGPYDEGEIVSEFVKRAGGRCNPEIIRLFVANSGEMMDNMMSLVPETSNLLTDEEQYIIQVAYGRPDGSYYPVEQSGYKSWATTMQTIGTVNPTPVNGREGLSRLTELETYVMLEAISLGAEWYHELETIVLVQDDDAVTGVIAQGPDGKYTKFLANKGVLLATGDFAANADMCWELLSEMAEWAERVGQDKQTITGASDSDGAGHKMGCWAGGFIEQHPRPTMSMGGGGGGAFGTAPFLWVNAFGKRYMNEAQTSAAYNETLRQPVGPVCMVTDSKWMETVQKSSIDHGAPNWGYPKAFEKLQRQMDAVYGTGAEGNFVSGVAIINIQMMASDEPSFFDTKCYGADTLDELAGYLGYEGESKETLLETIREYNEMCYAGKDSQYGKEADIMIPIDEPPYYGVATENTGHVSTGLVTLTGLVTNDKLQVLKSDRMTPVKGLYAAGNCVGQRYGNAYTTPSAGNSMGMAMTHGRVVGKIMASS